MASQILGTLVENGIILATAGITSWWRDRVQDAAEPLAPEPVDADEPTTLSW